MFVITLQAGRQCFCGNTYGSYGVADNCNNPCRGNAEEICGGGWANSVYQVVDIGNNSSQNLYIQYGLLRVVLVHIFGNLQINCQTYQAPYGTYRK